MGNRANITLTPPYGRDPATASTTGANPIVGSSGVASAGAPPTTGLARALFMAPQTTSVAGGSVPVPAVEPRAPFSKLPNAAVVKKGKLTIAQNLFQGEEKKTKKGRMNKGRPFTLHHCYEVLKDDEKWKPREGVNEETNKHKRSIDLDDDDAEASSYDGKRSLTPNSVAYSKPKRPNGGKKDAKEKKKRKGNDELTIAMEAIVNARKEANEVRKMARNQDAMDNVRRLATEERKVVAEERKVALKEKKLVMEEQTRLL
ncbi:Alternative oxidase 1a, mitochondrial [Hordeum vulgare]|nr:Alternative oxidase 1a, mitochondrial [Hordeum vulgare]